MQTNHRQDAPKIADYFSLSTCLIGMLWVLVQVFFYFKIGIFTELEAQKYIGNALHFLETGYFTNPRYVFYSSYIFFLSLMFKLNISYGGIVIIQILLNGLATIALYRITYLYCQSTLASKIACIVFILNYQIQSWNVYLYTESFYISLLVLFTTTLFEGFLKQKKHFVFASILLFVALCFSRPMGILYLLPSLIFIGVLFSLKTAHLKKWMWSFMLLGSLIFVWILESVLDNHISYLMNNLMTGAIICDVPPTSKPSNLNIPSNNYGSIVQLTLFLLMNFKYIIGLLAEKLFYFFALYRSFYSSAHNLLLFTFYPVYLFALASLFNSKTNRGIRYYCFAVILLFTLTIIITCVEWSGRFVVSILPFIIVLAAPNLEKALKNLLPATPFHKDK